MAKNGKDKFLQRPGAAKSRTDPSTAGADLAAQIDGLLRAGRLAEAERLLRQKLAVNPHDRPAMLALATTLRSMRRFPEALAALEPGLRKVPQDAAAVAEAGLTFHAAGRLDEAIEAYRRALQLDPTSIPIRLQLGRALLDKYQPDAAIRILREGLERAPNHEDLTQALAYAYLTNGNPGQALPHYEHISRTRPGAADVWAGVGTCRRILGDTAGAKEAFEKALALRPGLSGALVGLSKVYEEEGDQARAQALIEPLIRSGRHAPDLVIAYAGLLERAGRAEEGVPLLRTALESPGSSGFGRSLLWSTLGSLLEKVGRYDEAFAAYRESNSLAPRTFRPAKCIELTDRIIATFSRAMLTDAGHGLEESSELPVLVVGMPRSGTSLLEQILASHPNAFGAGELTDLGALASGAGKRFAPGTGFPESAAGLTPASLRVLADQYLDRLREAAGPEAHRAIERVTDKMPQNYLFLGLFTMLFPRGRIIHSVRSPLDTCFSCYATSLSAHYDFTNDLADLAVAYRQYRRLMSHWREVLPTPIADIRYESLVADRQTWTRQLVDAAGLPWNDACLAHHESRRVVRTASMHQASRPVYASSVARWKRFEKHLGPLIDGLGEIALESEA